MKSLGKNNLALIYNAVKKENTQVVNSIKNFLEKKKINVWVGKAVVPDSDWDSLPDDIDFSIIVGGDGTLLGASRILAPKNIPLFGINTGRLGFLTEGTGEKTLALVEEVLNNNCQIEERVMLAVYIANNGPMYALNDVVISRGTSNKMIHLTLNVNEKPVADYIADGLIVSTPTGSTAYALSAGGAVMDPEIHGIEIVPICAHSLTNRPHIVSDSKTLTITFNRPHEGTVLQLDGQQFFPVSFGTKIEIKRAKHNTKLIRLLDDKSNFYYRIRQKFHWGRTTS